MWLFSAPHKRRYKTLCFNIHMSTCTTLNGPHLFLQCIRSVGEAFTFFPFTYQTVPYPYWCAYNVFGSVCFPFPFTYQTLPYPYWCAYNVFGSVCFPFLFPQRKHQVISQLLKFYQHCLGIRLYPICVMVVLIVLETFSFLTAELRWPCTRACTLSADHINETLLVSILFFIFI